MGGGSHNLTDEEAEVCERKDVVIQILGRGLIAAGSFGTGNRNSLFL